jgi:hypothetical protein
MGSAALIRRLKPSAVTELALEHIPVSFAKEPHHLHEPSCRRTKLSHEGNDDRSPGRQKDVTECRRV